MCERALPLWREPQRLPSVLSEAAASLGTAETMAVTMTAELADCFATKREGVASVLDAFKTAFPAIEPWVYGTDGAFRPAAEARRRPLRVAAANWMASATVVSGRFPDALFIDVGSTTTDIIPIVGGRVAARGKTDPARLRSGELIYTGALRTPVCADGAVGAAARPALPRGRRAFREPRRRPPVARSDRRRPTTRARRPMAAAAAGLKLARAWRGWSAPTSRCLASAGSATSPSTWRARRCDRSSRGLRQVMRRLGPRCPRIAVVAGQGSFVATAAALNAGLEVHRPGRLDSAPARRVRFPPPRSPTCSRRCWRRAL